MKKANPPFPSKNIQLQIRTCSRHGDYELTGLIPFTEDKWSPCPRCKEEAENIKKTAELEESRIRKFQLNLRASGLEERFMDKTFEGFIPQNEPQRIILQTVMQYAEDFERHRNECRCLGFLGDIGVGKTHLAISLLRQIIIQGFTGRYVRAYEMFNAIKESWDYGHRKKTEAEVMEDFISPDLLVIDEIGVQYLTQAEMILMYKIVEGRYGRKNPITIISNLPIPDPKKPKGSVSQTELKNKSVIDVEDAMGERSYDRLFENNGILLEFRGFSYRRLSHSAGNSVQQQVQ